MNPHEKCPGLPLPATRRDFLQQAAALATGLGAAAPALAAAEGPTSPASLLPTIKLGPHQVTRLIIGGNPVYGYSHFNRILSQYLTEWHTPERVMALLQRCEQAGLNCWQNSYAERTLQDLERYRAAGGKMQWLCLGKPDWDQHPSAWTTPPSTSRSAWRRMEPWRAPLPGKEAECVDRPPEAHPQPGGAGGIVGPQPGPDRAGRGEGLGRGLLHVLSLLPDASS